MGMGGVGILWNFDQDCFRSSGAGAKRVAQTCSTGLRFFLLKDPRTYKSGPRYLLACGARKSEKSPQSRIGRSLAQEPGNWVVGQFDVEAALRRPSADGWRSKFAATKAKLTTTRN